MKNLDLYLNWILNLITFWSNSMKKWIFNRYRPLLVEGGLPTQVLGPIDIAKLWNLFNRIRITMGKFGCLQIRTSSSCNFEKKKILILFLGLEYFAQRFNRPVDKMPKKDLPIFRSSGVGFLANKGGYRHNLAWLSGLNVPLVLLIDPWTWLVDVL